MTVAANLARIKETIGTSPVTLIAVTKSVGIDGVEEAYRSGVTQFGENRVQDALEKQNLVPSHMADKISWHLIGHLQTNKVKKVIGKFDLIHSVDSIYLATEISEQAIKAGVKQAILLQVKVVEDPGKYGFAPDELEQTLPQILSLPGVSVKGLMTMAPLSSDREIWQKSFCGLRDLRDRLETKCGIELKELSMGMTDDWQEAIKCGSTMVRLGRAIFSAEGEVPARPS